MSRSLIAVMLFLAGATPSWAQYRFLETAEPPLADAVENGRTGRNPMMLTSSTRVVDAPVPVVQLSVRAPAVHAAGSPLSIKLVVENVGRSPAANVVVFYPLVAGAVVATAKPEATPISGGVTWKFDSLAAASHKEIELTLTPPTGAAEMAHKARISYEFDGRSGVEMHQVVPITTSGLLVGVDGLHGFDSIEALAVQAGDGNGALRRE